MKLNKHSVLGSCFASLHESKQIMEAYAKIEINKFVYRLMHRGAPIKSMRLI